MLDNVVYFSGVHGSGKSTLIRELAKYDCLIEHKRVHSLTLQDTYLRAVWRVAKYYIEANEQSVMAENSEGSIVLGNRCVYDNFAYINAFYELGWISSEDTVHHRNVFEAMFLDCFRPKHIVYLAPSFDWVRGRLACRWEAGEKKWREDDMEYLSKVIDAYDVLYSSPSFSPGVLRVEETDLLRRVELVACWLKDMGLIKTAG